MKAIRIVLVTLTLLVGGLVATATPAQAAYTGNIYIAFPKWLGNCPKGGSVKRIWASNGLSTWNWDQGDDLVYGRSTIGAWSSVQYTLFCQTTWYGLGYYQPGFSTSYYATRSGQTVFVGPGGWTRN